MNWHHAEPAMTVESLENSVEKTGASESVAIVAIIWGIALIVAASNA